MREFVEVARLVISKSGKADAVTAIAIVAPDSRFQDQFSFASAGLWVLHGSPYGLVAVLLLAVAMTLVFDARKPPSARIFRLYRGCERVLSRLSHRFVPKHASVTNKDERRTTASVV